MAASIPYARIGSTVKGAAAYLRVEAAIAWKHLVAVVKADMGVDLGSRIIQARGGAAASAGTHSDGAAVDVRVWGLTNAQRRRIVLLARECGFPASWDRPWEGNEHLHLGADVHNAWTHVDYQVIAVKDGYNGLGKGGRGGRDDGPKPSAWRNTTTGAAWALQRLNATPGLPSTGDKPAPTPQEDIMTPEQEARIIDAITAQRRTVQIEGLDRSGIDPIAKTTAEKVAAMGFARPIIERNAEAAARHTGVILDAKLAALRQAEQDIRAHGVDEDLLARIEQVAHRGALSGAKAGTEQALDNLEATVTIGTKEA